MKHALPITLILVMAGCTAKFPDNPTAGELEEMHVFLNECLGGIIPLEKSYSRNCRSVEDALIAYYGSLDAYLAALRARK